jgi:hypothetical protein
MIYVISKATFGSYNVRDIQCNANWDCCPYSDYALIPDSLVDGILATQGYCDITLNDAGTVVTGFTARSIPAVPEECCGTNTVLSVNGVKANTSGDVALAHSDVGAAPAGYGLGDERCTFVSLDEITKNGYYLLWLDTANGDFSTGQFACHAVVNANTNSVHLSGKHSGGFVHRDKIDGVWQPWEWVNPPMIPGVEYRTTERYNGQPVYTKLLDCGALPNASRKEVAHGISNCTPLSYYGTWANNTQAIPDSAFSVTFSYSKIVIVTTSDLSGETLTLGLKYTKN